ncbi:MAG: hypothetical protein M3Z38_03950 [Bombilactobacillus mellifer]|nr:hypothetical protein [Bombilactobacillus mellifer]
MVIISVIFVSMGKVGGNTIALQAIFDKTMPSVLSVLVTMVVYLIFRHVTML